jgi:filamentous hemagglutinin family protein
MKRAKILLTLRKTLAYVLIFSLLCQNIACARGPIQLIDEELPASRTRLHGSHRIGIVEPGSIREDGVHNIYEDLQISEMGGLVFTGQNEGRTIYNRVYSDDPIQLSGTFSVESPAPVVFGNCGGIKLDNPEFNNVSDLNLTAGHLALTDKGMGYEVDDGDVSINHTVIAEDNNVKNLTLTGRDIQINQSLLNPTEQINITTGSHIGVFGPQGSISVFPDEREEDTADSPISIYTDESSILRSKGILFQSLENSASIYSHGMIESTDEDIIIRARGDIYLNKLVANRNLIIETTGRVYFKDSAYVGGSVHVKAEKICVEKELSSVGKLYLAASQHLGVTGAICSHDEVSLKGQESMDLKGYIGSKRGVELDSPDGQISGQLETQGRLESRGQSLTISGKVTADLGSYLKLDTVTNKGRFSSFGAGLEGTIKKLQNAGKLDFSGVHATISQTIIEKTGVMRTRGGFDLKGDSYENNGKVFTCGVHRTNLKDFFKDEGTFYSPTLFLLDAKSVDYSPSHKSFLKDALINASLGLTVEKGAQFNILTVDHRGTPDSYLFHLTCKGSLNYHGVMRQSSTELFPLLDFFKIFDESTNLYFQDFAEKVYSIPLGTWQKVKKEQTKGIIFKSSKNINCEGANIQPDDDSVSLIANNTIKTNKSNIKAGYFKGNNATAQGKIVTLTDSKLISLFGDASIIAREQATLSNAHLKGQRSATLQATSTFMDKGIVDSAEGVANILATKDSTFKNSNFKGFESTRVISGNATFHSTTLNSQNGSTLVKAESVEFTDSEMNGENTTVECAGKFKSTDSSFKAKNDLGLLGESVDMDRSSARGGNNASVHARNKAALNRTAVSASHSAGVSGTDVSLQSTQVQSKKGTALVHAKKSVDSTDSAVKGKSAIIYAGTRANTINTQVEGDQKAGVYSQNVGMKKSNVSSTHGTATVQGDDDTNLSGTSAKAKKAATVRGRNTKLDSSQVESQDELAHIFGDKSLDIEKSDAKGKSTLVESKGKVKLSLSRLVGEYNRVTGKTIDAKKNDLEGRTDFVGQESVKIQEIKADNLVTATAKKIEFSRSNKVGSLNAKGKHITNRGDIDATDNSCLKAGVIDQLGSTKAGKTSYIEAKKKYNDKKTSRNEAGENLFLLAEKTNGFKGQQVADTVVIKLKDMNLLELLNQTQARVTEAHLKNTEVQFDEDTIIDRTLHLWAKRLENKKNLTVNGDFSAHIQKQIHNTGKMLVHGKSSFESDEFINLSGTVVADDIFVRARKFVSERLVGREYTATGHRDNLKAPAILRARKADVSVNATESLKGIGAHFEAKKSVHLKSNGILHLGAQETEEDIRTKSKKSSSHVHSLTNHKSTIVAKQGDATTHSGNDTLLYGVDITAGGVIRVKSERALRIINVHDTHEKESQKKSKGGIFKRKKTKIKQEATENVLRNFFKAGKDVTFESEEDAVVQAPDIESGGKTTIRSNKGKVFMASDKTTHMFHLQKSGRNAFWQSSQDKGSVDEQVLMANIRAKGGVNISGAKGVSVEFNKSLDLLENDPNTAWIKKLRHNSKVDWVHVEEEHKKWNKKVQGLTPGGAALLAIVVSVATAGAGSAIAGAVNTAITQIGGSAMMAKAVGSAAAAGFKCLVQKAALSLVNNMGDIGKVLKDLGSKDSLKGLAKAMVVAGLVGNSSAPSGNLSLDGLYEHFKFNAIQGAANAAVDIAGGEKAGDVLMHGLINIAANSAAGYAANLAANLYLDEDISYLGHKGLHGIIGAALGVVSNPEDPGAGASGGAIGGMGSEVLAGAFNTFLPDQTSADLAKFLSVSASVFARVDHNAAERAGTNAIENNFYLTKKSLIAFPNLIEDGGEALSKAAGACHDFMSQDIPFMSEANEAARGIIDSAFGDIERSPYLRLGLETGWDMGMSATYGPLHFFNRALPEFFQFLPTPQGTAHAAVDMVLPKNGYGAAITASMVVTRGTVGAARSFVGKGLGTGFGRFGAATQEMRAAWRSFQGLDLAISGKPILNEVLQAKRVGSALKNDLVKPIRNANNTIIREFPIGVKAHGFPNIIDNYAGNALKFQLDGGATLLQLEGSLGGRLGRFEWITNKGKVTHRMFVEEGSINGIPIKK